MRRFDVEAFGVVELQCFILGDDVRNFLVHFLA
jgi:hypothetical protein